MNTAKPRIPSPRTAGMLPLDLQIDTYVENLYKKIECNYITPTSVWTSTEFLITQHT